MSAKQEFTVLDESEEKKGILTLDLSSSNSFCWCASDLYGSLKHFNTAREALFFLGWQEGLDRWTMIPAQL